MDCYENRTVALEDHEPAPTNTSQRYEAITGKIQGTFYKPIERRLGARNKPQFEKEMRVREITEDDPMWDKARRGRRLRI